MPERTATGPCARSFTLEPDEEAKFQAWTKEHNAGCRYSELRAVGPTGGRFTFHFNPTSLGTYASVSCLCGAKADLTDDADW